MQKQYMDFPYRKRKLTKRLMAKLIEEDRILETISNLSFLRDCNKHFSVEEAGILIDILFPTKAKKIYTERSSYSFKHLFESVSKAVNHKTTGHIKYCSNQTAIQAFEQQGFKCVGQDINRDMNVLKSEVERSYRLFGYPYPCA